MTDFVKIRMAMRSIAAATAVVLVAGAGSVFAHVDVSGFIDTSGPNSINKNLHEVDDDIDVDIENSTDVDEDVDIDASTGGSEIENVTTAGDLEGGDISGSLEFVTDVSSGSTTDITIDPLHISADFGVDTSGPFSENRNELEYNRDINVDIENDTEIDTDVDVDAETGGQRVRNVTTVGDVSSGSVDMDFEFDTQTNLGQSTLDLSSLTSSSVNADFSHDTTGPNSTNTNLLTVNNDVDVDIENDTEINRDIDLDFSTGENSVENTTTAGDVRSGDIDFSVRSRIR